MNLFSYKTAAQRYAKGRHYFHLKVIVQARQFLKLTRPVGAALDVGCGTGLSTVALAEIAERVVGVDASEAMVALAPKHPRVSYAVAPAEELPFGDGVFELLTASQSFHWFDRGRFLREAHRVLTPGGHLVVYDYYFSGHMPANAALHVWFREEYLTKYPSPKRGELVFTESESREHGFHLLAGESHDHALLYSQENLIDYLTSQSNVIEAVEGRGETIAEVRDWLAASIGPLFGDRVKAAFIFQGPIWYLEKLSVVRSQ